jgi:hypothetical protein
MPTLFADNKTMGELVSSERCRLAKLFDDPLELVPQSVVGMIVKEDIGRSEQHLLAGIKSGC